VKTTWVAFGRTYEAVLSCVGIPLNFDPLLAKLRTCQLSRRAATIGQEFEPPSEVNESPTPINKLLAS
jgi:hypothetical protein